VKVLRAKSARTMLAAVTAGTAPRPKGAYDEYVRWQVVFKRLVLGWPHAAVTEALGPTRLSQRDIIDRFETTGGVETHMGRRKPGRTQSRMSSRDDLWLLGDVLDDPSATLQERADRLRLRSGVTVHISCICRAMRRLNLTCGKMQHWARQRDEQRIASFVVELMTFCSIDEIIVIDETSKDRSHLRGTFGWSARGCPPIERHLLHHRDQRVSALVAMSVRGMEDWRFTAGTYDTERFEDAAREILIDSGLVPIFPNVLMDNASIHKQSFEDEIAAAGGRVWRVPPYSASSTSPLDNGGFGLVVRYLHFHAHELAHLPMVQALDIALRQCCSPAAARYCFYNCGYKY
jgi:transposase